MCAVFNRLGHHEKAMLNLVDALNNVERVAKSGVVGIQLPYAVSDGGGGIFLIKRLFTYFCGSAGALRVRGKKDGCRPRVRLNISTAIFSRDMASRGVFRIEYV
jgi:hypothetical protein